MQEAYKKLRLSTRRWVNSVKRNYVLEDHQQKILLLAAQAWDRSQQASETVKTEGPTILDRFGQAKAHPAISIEKEATLTFLKCMRELALDIDGGPEEYSRPPRQY